MNANAKAIDPRHALADLLGIAAYHPAVTIAFRYSPTETEPLDVLVARAVAGAEGGARPVRILAVRVAVRAVLAWIAEDPWFREFNTHPDDVTLADVVSTRYLGARDRV